MVYNNRKLEWIIMCESIFSKKEGSNVAYMQDAQNIYGIIGGKHYAHNK